MKTSRPPRNSLKHPQFNCILFHFCSIHLPSPPSATTRHINQQQLKLKQQQQQQLQLRFSCHKDHTTKIFTYISTYTYTHAYGYESFHADILWTIVFVCCSCVCEMSERTDVRTYKTCECLVKKSLQKEKKIPWPRPKLQKHTHRDTFICICIYICTYGRVYLFAPNTTKKFTCFHFSNEKENDSKCSFLDCKKNSLNRFNGKNKRNKIRNYESNSLVKNI